MKRICLVTEELATFGSSGGIGGAFLELAVLLCGHGHSVDVLYCPLQPLSAEGQEEAVRRAEQSGFQLRFLDPDAHVWGEHSAEKRSYAVFRDLLQNDGAYDAIHFHDYKGLGHFSIAAKRQRIAFAAATLVVQLHGPSRWTLSANQKLWTHEDQLTIDFLERMSIEHADRVVSPSAYLVEWLARSGGVRRPAERTSVIRNVCSMTSRNAKALSLHARPMDGGEDLCRIGEIVFFGRHEERKGFTEFCDAIDLIHETLAERGISVTFLGPFGLIGGSPSGVVLANRSKSWAMDLRILPNFDRAQSAHYLSSSSRQLVVVPSPEENSPYTVLEALVLQKPLLTSDRGGARELIDSSFHEACLCRIDAAALSSHILRCVHKGAPRPRLQEDLAETERKWIAFHDELPMPASGAEPAASRKTQVAKPRVVFGITHFERPEKLLEALFSASRQTYENMEIVVVDDGSASAHAKDKLKEIEVAIKRLGGKLIRQENKYLGAARNAIIRETESDYLCFLDDDDIAFPELVETLVRAATATGADVVNCFNLFMEEQRRHEAWPEPSRFRQKVSYVPTGGPLALAPVSNNLGAATALIRRSTLLKAGGYSEIHGVGYEDYELYTRILQAGGRIEICPLPLYLYETGRPSMLSRTSTIRNFKRVFDAIDLSFNTGAWSDLVQLDVGKRAAAHEANRLAWATAQDPHAELLKMVSSHQAGSEAALSALKAYCEAIGSEAGARAYAGAIAACRARGAKPLADDSFAPPRSMTSVLSAQNRPSAAKSDLATGIMLDIGMGEARRAVNRIAAAVAAHQIMTDETLRAIDLLLGDDGAQDILPDLIGMISNARVLPSQEDKALAMLFSLALKAGNDQVAATCYAAALKKDELLYLQKYDDLRIAAERKQIKSGFDHFCRAGRREKRLGFARVDNLAATFARTTGISLPPEQISGILRTAEWRQLRSLNHLAGSGAAQMIESASLN